MEQTADIQVIVRLFGLSGGVSRLTRSPIEMPMGTTVQGLLDRLRSQAAPGDRLAAVHPDGLLVLVNGHPIQYLDGWNTVLRDRDEITYLVKTAGG